MYYAIGASVPSLHRESTDSLIHYNTWKIDILIIYFTKDPKDIAQQDLEQVLALLWVIICNYHLSAQVLYCVATCIGGIGYK